MFKRIMVPVDLGHLETLDKALAVTAQQAKLYEAPVTYVGVTMSAPSAVAHNPEEFGEKLAAFAAGEGSKHGIAADSRAVVSHDTTIDLDDALMKTAREMGADLIVMQSHVPGLADYIWPSNGGTIASHASASVMVVR
ncbi:MAG: universal stress protein [Pseudomonadota bacterium]